MSVAAEAGGKQIVSSGKIADIQALRALAIVMVILTHIQIAHPYLPEIVKHGQTGVDLFFVISGFVITRSAMLIPLTSFRLEFFSRRIFRILPAAIFTLLVFDIFFVALGGSLAWEITRIARLSYNYEMQGAPSLWLGHYWSLLVEEHFYIAFGLLFPLIVRTRFCVPVLCSLALMTIFYLRPNATDPSHMTHARIDNLIAGVLIAYCSIRLPLGRWASVCGLGLAAVVWSAFYLALPEAFTVTMAASAGLVFIASQNANVFVLPFALHRAVDWVGERSYSLYLTHPLVHYADYFGSVRTG